MPWFDVARAAVAIAVILIGGRFLLRPLFRAIGGAKTPEVFTTVALLIVAGTALIATVAGLSPSLGAFMAGVLLSESEYRHELQADIEPFEGLLLGFFFISVGMSADLSLARAQPVLLAGATAALLVAKAAIAFGLARIAGQNTPNALRFSLALPQASEFSFVLFGAAVAAGALDAGNAAFATLVTAASMVATPILFAGAEAILARLRRAPPPEYDTIDAAPTPVIIAASGASVRSSAACCVCTASSSPRWSVIPARWRWCDASAPRCISAIPRGQTFCARRVRSRPSCWS